MIKNKGCAIFLITATSLVIGGLIIFVMFVLHTRETTISTSTNASKKQTIVLSDPFYNKNPQWGSGRLPLIKPYELVAFDRLFENPSLINTRMPETDLKRQITSVRKINISGNYFIAYIDVYGNSNIKYCYLILDLGEKGYSEFDIHIDYDFHIEPKNKFETCYMIAFLYGKKQNYEEFKTREAFLSRAKLLGFLENKIINNQIRVRIPEKYWECVFFNEKDLKSGLKARGIPEDIKLLEPKYFYRKFLDEGQCHWFPK